MTWSRNSWCRALISRSTNLRVQINGRLLLSDAENKTLADIGHRLGRKALEEVANAAKPDTLMGWYRKLVARKFDRSKSHRYPDRPRIDPEVEQLVGRLAMEIADIAPNPHEVWMEQIARNVTTDE